MCTCEHVPTHARTHTHGRGHTAPAHPSVPAQVLWCQALKKVAGAVYVAATWCSPRPHMPQNGYDQPFACHLEAWDEGQGLMSLGHTQ